MNFIACWNKISTKFVSLAVSVPIVLTCLPPVLTPPTSPTIPSQSVPFHCSPPQLLNTETRCLRWLLRPTLSTTNLLDLMKAEVSTDRSPLLVRSVPHLQFSQNWFNSEFNQVIRSVRSWGMMPSAGVATTSRDTEVTIVWMRMSLRKNRIQLVTGRTSKTHTI